jgi:hypothetical protein
MVVHRWRRCGADSSALPPNIGTLERFAAYPLIFTELVAGIALLIDSARLRRRNPPWP